MAISSRREHNIRRLGNWATLSLLVAWGLSAFVGLSCFSPSMGQQGIIVGFVFGAGEIAVIATDRSWPISGVNFGQVSLSDWRWVHWPWIFVGHKEGMSWGLLGPGTGSGTVTYFEACLRLPLWAPLLCCGALTAWLHVRRRRADKLIGNVASPASVI